LLVEYDRLNDRVELAPKVCAIGRIGIDKSKYLRCETQPVDVDVTNALTSGLVVHKSLSRLRVDRDVSDPQIGINQLPYVDLILKFGTNIVDVSFSEPSAGGT